MRVTQNSFSESLVSRLNTLNARQYGLQSQVSSGLRVQAPSDDPVAMQNVLNYKTSKAAQEQFAGNISTLQERASSIYSVLQRVQTLSNQVGEISIRAGDGTLADLTVFANNVSSALEQAVQEFNTQDPATGQYLFGGTASSRPPFVATRDAAGKITAVTYQGNGSVNQTAISPNSTLSVDVPGASSSGSNPRGLVTDASGADFFNHLISLRDHLLVADKAAITATDIPALRKDEDNIIYHVSNNGALQSRLEAAATAANANSTSLDKLISKASEADIVQTLVELNEAQNSYQAALQSGAKVMQLSLLNYIQ